MRPITVVCSSYDYLQPPNSPAVLALDAVRDDYFRMETQAKDLVQEFQQEADQVVGKSKRKLLESSDCVNEKGRNKNTITDLQSSIFWH